MHFAQISPASQVICMTLIDFPFLVLVLGLHQPQVCNPCCYICFDRVQWCWRGGAPLHQAQSHPGQVAALHAAL